MAYSRAVVKNGNPQMITVDALQPGEFGVLNTGRVVYKPTDGLHAQTFDGGTFTGHTTKYLVRKLLPGEVIEITIQ
jgi:hypothetical protein